MQERSSPVVRLRPAGFLMSEKPPVRVSGVDHIKVPPDERSVWWCKRKLGILALRVNVGMAVPSVELVVSTGDGEPDKREKRKEHGEEIAAGHGLILMPILSTVLVKFIKRASLCEIVPLRG